ncbi:MAG TPA: DNA gyrase inhibitor YacG [Gemmataceae bacterium]|jgi:endogenous inhibitor of DNA gyrase (YacG/DUF329 family)|nr:DNA gyrase inhibitor YacG [Gemmataceae bacterium]
MIRVRCPICDRWMMGASTKEWPDFPFCSPRCRLVDLGRWLGEEYAVRRGPDAEQTPAPDEDEENIP